MITFATIFLGLVLGVQPVSVVVGEEVARVEFLLDGERIATVQGPPWKADCDFGTDLVPHTFEAVALDAEGVEVARTLQRLNLPRPMADARIVLEEEGSATYARVIFESVFRSSPLGVTVRFDGEEIEVADIRRFPLPPFDSDHIHYLSVQLEFPQNVSRTVETTFGGAFSDFIGTPQTAVPVVARRGRLPKTPTELVGSFHKDGEPLKVIAIDDGPAEVVIVRDLSSQADLDRLVGDLRGRLRVGTKSISPLTRTPPQLIEGSLRFASKLKKDQLVWILEPFARQPGGHGYHIAVFPFSPHLTSKDGGLPYLLNVLRPPHEPVDEQRLADAVAVAGSGVAERDRRRAVLLILADGYDQSALQPEVARRYLESMHVPLVVWSTREATPEIRADWGEVREILTLNRLQREVRELSDLLDRQSIVWLEGFHLPQRISLAAGSRRLDFPM